MLGEFGEAEPAAAEAVGGDGGELEGWLVDVVKEAAVDEVLGGDGLVLVGGREVEVVVFGELELVVLEVGDFSEEVIAGVGAGEVDFGAVSADEVEFCGEFEVDEVVGGEVAEEEVEFANGGVFVLSDLEAFFEDVEMGGGGEELGEGVFEEVAKFLAEVQGLWGGWEGEEMAGKGGG